MHNTLLLDHPQKSVIYAPWIHYPTHLWNPKVRNLDNTSYYAVKFQAYPGLVTLNMAAVNAIRGWSQLSEQLTAVGLLTETMTEFLSMNHVADWQLIRPGTAIPFFGSKGFDHCHAPTVELLWPLDEGLYLLCHISWLNKLGRCSSLFLLHCTSETGNIPNAFDQKRWQIAVWHKQKFLHDSSLI